jgi:GT2 family glycosyltransferase
MNPILVLTHNGYEMNKRCIESALDQDIPTWVHVVDNDSQDKTWPWLKEHTTAPVQFSPQIGVNAGWNVGLHFLFDCEDAEHVLVINSDTILPKWFYSSLLSYDVSFVTGMSVSTMEEIAQPQPRKELATGPDFSAFLIHCKCWDKVGPFDENMVHYCGDLDYDLRAHRKGIKLWNAGVPFFHDRSSTLRNASSRDRRIIELQADADRMAFAEKWGAEALGTKYAELFDEKYFGIDTK